MSNSIELGKAYLPVLQKTYVNASKTSVLENTSGAPRKTDIAGTYLIPTIETVGLGTYNKVTGSPAGDVTFAWVPYSFTQDRGRNFTIDAVDDLASFGMAFGSVAGQFNRRSVVPEVDAYRIAKIANTADIQSASGVLTTAAGWKNALNAATVAMDEAEVDDGERVLFITPTGFSAIKNDAATAAQTDAFERCTTIVVPQSRMNTAVALNAGASAAAGGYTRTGSDVNFLMLDKGAVWAGTEHEALRIFTPMENQGPNAWKVDYRLFHDCFVRTGLEAGVYCHADEVIS